MIKRSPLNLFKKKSAFGVSPIGAVLSYAVLGFWAFLVLFPLYWIAITAFKLPSAVGNGPFYIPFVDFEPSLHAWRYIFGEEFVGTTRKYQNTVAVSLLSTLISVMFGSLAAYALSRFEFKPKVGTIFVFIGCLLLAIVLGASGVMSWGLALGIAISLFIVSLLTLSRRYFKRSLGNGNIAFWLISQRIMPPIAAVIPIYFFFLTLQNASKAIGLPIKLIDTWFALITTYVAANLPIVVWLMRDYFANIPKELEESAAIDGASRLRIFFSVMLPLVMPGLVATFLFVLVFAWNEYLLALFLTNANAQTMPMFVVAQNATRGPQWWYLSVLVLIMILPVILLAIVLERFISRGLLVGAVKG
jgi:multiple sugar transport system permease protein